MNTTFFIPELERSEAKCWKSLYSLSTFAIQKKLKLATTKIAGATCLAAGGTDTLGFNRVVGLGISSPINARILDSIINFYRDNEVSRFFIQLPPLQLNAHNKQLLKTEGFKYHNSWSKYFYDLRNVVDIPAPSTRFTVAPVKPNQIKLFSDIICRSFEFDFSIQEFIVSTYGKLEWKYYFALDKNEPVAAASLCIIENHAKLVLGGTLSKARNAGAQSLLITKRINEAISKKCHTVSTETSQDTPEKPSYSARNMQKFGFRLGYHRANFIHEF